MSKKNRSFKDRYDIGPYPVWVLCGILLGKTAKVENERVSFEVGNRILPVNPNVIDMLLNKKYIFKDQKTSQMTLFEKGEDIAKKRFLEIGVPLEIVAKLLWKPKLTF